jgi:putative addiction module killer protein
MATGTRFAVEYYESPNGRSPFIEWLESIEDVNNAQHIRQRIDRFEHGNLGDIKPVKGRSGLFEARLFFGPGFRLYFALEKNRLIVLLCGGDKSTQRSDVRKAQALFDAHRSE